MSKLEKLELMVAAGVMSEADAEKVRVKLAEMSDGKNPPDPDGGPAGPVEVGRRGAGSEGQDALGS